MNKTEYVVGFCFDKDREQVALIVKNRPKWQAGKLNGIGGHVEPGETVHEAMVREFQEETGVLVPTWHNFLTLHYPDSVLYFYRAFDSGVLAASQTTDEQVIIMPIAIIEEFGRTGVPMGFNKLHAIHNIPWLIQMALSMDEELATCFEMTALVGGKVKEF
jgi:8-oxo-dGTP pyrophosphatase MutT (NUDIX family)